MIQIVPILLAAVLLGTVPGCTYAEAGRLPAGDRVEAARGRSPGGASDTLSVCVVRGREVRRERAVHDPATGDTAVAGDPSARFYPALPPPYADGTEWFAGQGPIHVQGLDYFMNGPPLALLPREIERVGEFRGVAVFSEKGGTPGDYGILFVPLAPGCQFAPYYYFNNSGPVRGDTDAVRIKSLEEELRESEMDIFPDPADRTALRLDDLRRLFILDYQQARGTLPDRLEEFMPEPGSAVRDYRLDGWGRPLRYHRSASDYELRSAGPDGRFDTADDLVVTRTRGIECQSPMTMAGCHRN